ncbi:transducin beta-like protein 3 [Chelonus insularis]|uniref:transducin beta-like protein 3 n=1 Tax=Chelonus insularis TaxID=460826 RepID=UPI001589AF84|nr:transducin beta-like protein 3 [Chelonus insularis]
MSTSNLKESFEVEAKHGAFYIGGRVKWSQDGEYLFCQNGASISILSISKGTVITSLGQVKDEIEEDTINCFNLNNKNDHVISHHKSGLFKLWSWKDEKITKLWKSIHKGPVSQIALSSDDNIMASGGSDSSVRLWNLEHHSCLFNLKGAEGVISVLEFHPDPEQKLVFAAGDNAIIHGWDIKTGEVKVLLSGHFSKVTSLSFCSDGKHLISSGRDKVLILWNIVQKTSVRILPVYEGLEGTFIIPSNINFPGCKDKDKSKGIFVAGAGEKGFVTIWEMRSGREIYTQMNSLVPAAKEDGGLSVTHLLFNKKDESFAMVSTDHNIIIHSLSDFECQKQFIGYSDEILDIAYIGDNGSHIAIATNSCDIKLYQLSTMTCQLLRGHTDLVLALATSRANRNLMISSAKDNSVRIWFMCKESETMYCIGSGVRHTSSVGSVALSNLSSNFFASVSQDSCLKLWSLPHELSATDQNIALNVEHTVIAHPKDINSVTISPNDKLLATGSQDKTAKLWNAENLQLLGVLRGHRRGVWCVRFSPIDQVLLTSSADCTVKLWSLSELNCIKTFEGHESSVLRAEFISRGMQLITSSGDGLLKLWCVKTSECITTLDAHDNRVWALAVSRDEKQLISGGSDSLLIIWRDVTEEVRRKAAEERERIVLEEQRLANLLKAGELIDALKLTLDLDKPQHTLRVIEGILKRGGNELTDAINELKPSEKEILLKCTTIWNTNSRNAHAAQLVINALMSDIGSGYLQLPALSSTLEALIPYTERHFKRVTNLLQDLHFLNYTITRIKPHIEPKINNESDSEMES